MTAVRQISGRGVLSRPNRQPLWQPTLSVNAFSNCRSSCRRDPRQGTTLLPCRSRRVRSCVRGECHGGNQDGHRLLQRPCCRQQHSRVVRVPPGCSHVTCRRTRVNKDASLFHQRRRSGHLDKQWRFGRATRAATWSLRLSRPIEHDWTTTSSELVGVGFFCFRVFATKTDVTQAWPYPKIVSQGGDLHTSGRGCAREHSTVGPV